MSFSDKPQNEPLQHHPRINTPLVNPNNLVTVYTISRILLTMRLKLGLEAMVEYLDRSVDLLERENPRLESAVTQALAIMNVEKIYKDAVKTDERKF